MNKPRKVLVMGSGPIIIGQAAEFDYAGTQACKSLREEGITTVLVNSNPATIMTDEDTADSVYIEPLTVDVLTRIIEYEKPDGILPTLGGQTALNLAVDLANRGVLSKNKVDLLGTSVNTIQTAEDRGKFKDLLLRIEEPLPPSRTVSTWDEAEEALKELGLPLVIRPAYTLGGTGGGLVHTAEEFSVTVREGLEASPINQVLIEGSLEGWREIEYEVMRDGQDNCITVCNMENLDAMGVHTGDSIVVAPSQTLTDKETQMLRSASLKIIRALGVEGGCNVQFALRPHQLITGNDAGSFGSDYYVIEVNPRVSRSSALASKATGYPIARVAAKIAIGMRLDDIANAVTQKTLAAFEPTLDYCVVKLPRWPFDKFPTGDRRINTQMKSTGEVMAIERSFEAALQKAIRSVEIGGQSLLWEDPSWVNEGKFVAWDLIRNATDIRLWVLMSALRNGEDPRTVSTHGAIDPWFTQSLQRIIDMETRLSREKISVELIWNAKRLGFSDSTIASLIGDKEGSIRNMRKSFGIKPVYKMVDTCSAEFEAVTPYYYSTYEEENEALMLEGEKAIVLGSGPIRIGQGIEFDYCSVHAARALQDANVKSIMINSNPETVSTDFDTSDRLYFEPLDSESILDVIDNETGEGVAPPTVVQFGGQTSIDLSQVLRERSLPILGSSARDIDIASDRQKFEKFMEKLDIPQPPGSTVTTLEEALQTASKIGYPVVVRPSYVLGGRAMEIVRNTTELKHYLANAASVGIGRPVLIDRYMEGKECEVDAVCDGKAVLIPGIMEHVERAGVHSGDSMAIYPALNLSEAEIATIVDYTTRIGKALNVKGLMNVQFVISGGDTYRTPSNDRDMEPITRVYVLEVNLRSSRTVPFLSKVTKIPMVRLATRISLGSSLASLGYKDGLWPNQEIVAIKAPVFSMAKLIGVDWYLGPEMKSTGEVMGLDWTFDAALTKALEASGMHLPRKGAALLSIADRDKEDCKRLISDMLAIGYRLYATEGTANIIQEMGGEVTLIARKLGQGSPNVVDVIEDGLIDVVINTVSGAGSTVRDGFEIRRAAAEKRIPCFTFLDTARVAVENLLSGEIKYNVETMNSYIKSISA